MKVEEINGEDICYYEQNQSSPHVLFLVHGNMGSHESWLEVYPLLKNVRVVAITLRGFGESSAHQSTSNLQTFSNDIIKLCQVKGIKKMTINGWSFGGLVCLKVAQMRPDLVYNVILTNAVGHLGFHRKDQQGNFIQDEVFINGDKIKKYQEFVNTKNQAMMRVVFDMVLFTHIKDLTEERKQQMFKMAFQQRITHRDMAYMTCKTQIDITKINAKWLIIVGANDKVVPSYVIEPTVEYLISNHKDVRVETLPGGHMGPMQEPQKYAQLVQSFVLDNKTSKSQ